jgi:hypothetical protein
MGGACSIQQRLRKNYKIFVEKKNEGLRREICRWGDNIKIEVSEIECTCVGVDWSSKVQDRQLVACFVNTQ